MSPPATRARVERLIVETGFVRSRAARALKRGCGGLIDLVVPDLESAYILAIIRGVEELLEPAGVRLALSATHNEARRERQWLTKIADGSTDGAILVLACGQSERLDELHRRHIPFVVVDHRRELGPDVPAVGATNWSGGYMATRYLLYRGGKEHSHVTTDPQELSTRGRRRRRRPGRGPALLPRQPRPRL